MTPNEYQQLAARTICPQGSVVIDRITNPLHNEDDAEQDTQVLHACIGLAGEAGELCSQMQKWLYYGQIRDDVNILEELGDCQWYIAEACTALGMTLEAIMENNIEKLQQRYPEKYTDHHAAEENRDREAEREILEQKQQAIEEYYTKVGEPVPLCPAEKVSETNEYDCVLITEALRSGWQLIGKDPKTIILRGDKSEGWVAVWRLVRYDGDLVRVPNWFRKRLSELEIEKEESEQRNKINKTGSQIFSQTGQGFAEPPEESEEIDSGVSSEEAESGVRDVITDFVLMFGAIPLISILGETVLQCGGGLYSVGEELKAIAERESQEQEPPVQQFLNTDLTYRVDLTYKGGLMTLQPSPTGFYCPNCLTSYSLEVTTGHFVPTYVDLTKVLFDTLEELAGKIIDSYVHSSKDVSRAHSELSSVKQKLYNEFTTAIQTGK